MSRKTHLFNIPRISQRAYSRYISFCISPLNQVFTCLFGFSWNKYSIFQIYKTPQVYSTKLYHIHRSSQSRLTAHLARLSHSIVFTGSSVHQNALVRTKVNTAMWSLLIIFQSGYPRRFGLSDAFRHSAFGGGSWLEWKLSSASPPCS